MIFQNSSVIKSEFKNEVQLTLLVDGVAASNSANLLVIPLASSFEVWNEYGLNFISDTIIIIQHWQPDQNNGLQYIIEVQTSLDGDDGTKGAGSVSIDSSTGSRSGAFRKWGEAAIRLLIF